MIESSFEPVVRVAALGLLAAGAWVLYPLLSAVAGHTALADFPVVTTLLALFAYVTAADALLLAVRPIVFKWAGVKA